ncbi:MAG: hypothetical protein P4L22_02930 [Candidatus Babeliales bacterium]|nr:hypothetical protein [Candidatus Babeliales bacterium]
MLKLITAFIFFILPLNFSYLDYAYPIRAFKAQTGRSRFGDCLSIIYTTKYLSCKYNLPVLFTKFNNYDELEIQKSIDSQENNFIYFNNIIKINNETEIRHYNEDTLFIVDVNFSLNKEEMSPQAVHDADNDFKKLIKLTRPIQPACPKLDKNIIKVALHVRKGGGYDLPLLSKDALDLENYNPENVIDADELAIEHQKKRFYFSDVRWPFKFPPDSFYLKQILYIYKLLNNKPLHVHIFTDDPNPKCIMEKYKKFINNPNITFSCRQQDNAHDKNVVDDFFAMSTFDCLIRPVSFYSENIQRIGNFKIVIFPAHGIWVKNDILIIDEVKTITK